MNFWKWFLFYIYSGVALAGLCAGKANELTNGLYTDDNTDAGVESEKMRRLAQDCITTLAQDIGNQMAHNTTASIVGSYNQELITNYESAQNANREQRKTAMAAVPPNARGN